MRKVRVAGPFQWILSPIAVVISFSLLVFLSGCGATTNKLSPTVTIAATPTSVSAGATSTLTVVAANATTVTVTGTDGSTYSLGATGGTQAVTPKATTTYTATAAGSNGQATATVVVTVGAASTAPTVTIAANPTTVNAGSPSTLTVAATNATKVTITGSDGTSYNVPVTGGTQEVTPAATTTYTVTAAGATGTTPATATATVTVVPVGPPIAPTVTITASPASINQGSSSTLTVTATNATAVTVTGTDGTTNTLPGAGGTQIVTPKTTTTYQAVASGPGGNATAQIIVTVIPPPTPTVLITANPTSLALGNSSVLTVTATNANTVTVTGTDGSSYSLATTGGTQSVTPKSTTTYTATATGAAGNATATATVTVIPPGTLQSIDHVIFMLQENHTFDNYFGMLNPYRVSKGWDVGDDGKTYNVDGIDDKLKTTVNQTDEGTSYNPFKLTTTCVDDMSSAWLESYGDVSRYSFLTNRSILMDGFVHNAEGFAKSCAASGTCSGTFTDTTGQRAMGYYDESYLNYYYYMASQFAVSNRWFSPVSSKSIPNRIATFTGGTTQGLVYDPGGDDKLLQQLNITTIFNELDKAGVSWKIYYTVTNGGCSAGTPCGSGPANYPDSTFSILSYSYQYMYGNPTAAACTGTTKPSSVVGDPSNSFCVDTTHIAPLSTYFQDLKNGTLPSYSFIESGSGVNDEHPGSGQSVLVGQAQVANIINSLMSSTSWKDSVFFLAYDEGGGPYDHVPPVPGHSNDFTTDATVTAAAPDIGGIAVNPDAFPPCVPATSTPTAPATTNCDLRATDPGAGSGDAAYAKNQGFAAQLGFRVPNMIISPFVRKHYVGNNPMDHTAILKFVENRFISATAHLTPRDAAQPDLTDFFDFTTAPWATPPPAADLPAPVPVGSSCHASTLQ
jgi:phospholipase C